MPLTVATRKGLFVLDQRQDWAITGRHFIGDPVTAVCGAAAAGYWLAALRLGHFGVKLRASNDNGASWQELPAPAYPPKPEAGAGEAEDPHPWSLEQIWILEGPHPQAPDRIWAGTLPGGLFRSDDRGASWQLVESLWRMPQRREWFGGGYDVPGIHSICVDPRDADDLVVGVSCGGAWRSRDGGASWEPGRGMQATYMPPERHDDPVIQDPHRIVQCAAAPEQLWTQHHCGIWRSTDRGASWVEVKTAQPSAFGFAVAAHPRDPHCAWFVPAASDERRVPVDHALCVTRTRDGGASFAALREGLPQRDAFDLVYRHGLDISADGSTLALGTTTGALWLSDSGGEHWRLLQAHLPPIYAVRFFD